jgi:hypothetical protein
MSATNATETALLNLIFKGTTWTSVAINATASPYTSYWISLHTASPGEAGDQTTSEAAYTGYARIEVTRDAGGWTVSGNAATNTSTVTFGKCTAAPGSDITHVGLGSASSGAGVLLLSNPLDTALSMAAGVTPLFEAGDLEFTCD